ncbi:MAG: carotenoid biosynthesis protein [Verrucomicrobia bacterium]|nr:carotenoid biosynthesis protein [Verrucomicrobiota bacterium]
MKHTLRAVATLGLAIYAYAELAAHVYPFVLLPQVGIPLKVIALTLFAVLHAGTNFGWRVGLLMFFATTMVTWSFEQVGVTTGMVYGAYHYSGMLGPKLGAVPLLIPLAWFMMMYPSYLVTSLIVDGHALPQKTDLKRLGTRAMIAAIVMTAWDAVIDPGMSRTGYWIWEHSGSYFGVPRQNFAGWLLTTFVVYGVFGLLQRWLKPPVRQRSDWFGFLPTLAYAIVTLVQVADREAGPSSVIAFFAMGFPALLAFVRWTQDSVERGLRRAQSSRSARAAARDEAGGQAEVHMGHIGHMGPIRRKGDFS